MAQSEIVWGAGAAVGFALAGGLRFYFRPQVKRTRVKFGVVVRATLVAVFGLSWTFCLPAMARENKHTPR